MSESGIQALQTKVSFVRINFLLVNRNPKSRGESSLFRVIELDDSALQSNGDGMRPVFCAEFLKDILDSALDRLFRNRQLRGDLFVGIACPDQPENIDFLWRQSFVSTVLGNLGGDLR
jgi:hypothetical protein